MDGEVVMFADSFNGGDGVFEPRIPSGPYEVSASRNAVVVHHANLTSDTAVEAFIWALRSAQKEARRLTQRGRGNYRIDSAGTDGDG